MEPKMIWEKLSTNIPTEKEKYSNIKINTNNKYTKTTKTTTK
jgi:hypothetical protein